MAPSRVKRSLHLRYVHDRPPSKACGEMSKIMLLSQSQDQTATGVEALTGVQPLAIFTKFELAQIFVQPGRVFCPARLTHR